VSKPIVHRSTDARLEAARKRLRLAERALSARQAARQIVYAAPAADVNLTAGAWSDICHASIVLAVPCRVRLTAQISFTSTNTGTPSVAGAIFLGASGGGSVPALVQGGNIDLQGTAATQPVQNAVETLTWELDLQPGLQFFTLSAWRNSAVNTTVAALKSRTNAGSTNDVTWLQVTAL